MVGRNRDDKTLALVSFCDTSEATGGVERVAHGLYAPVGDLEWNDLGEACLDACLALARLPKLVKELPDEGEAVGALHADGAAGDAP
jgi:hypothetical protein